MVKLLFSEALRACQELQVPRRALDPQPEAAMGRRAQAMSALNARQLAVPAIAAAGGSAAAGSGFRWLVAPIASEETPFQIADLPQPDQRLASD